MKTDFNGLTDEMLIDMLHAVHKSDTEIKPAEYLYVLSHVCCMPMFSEFRDKSLTFLQMAAEKGHMEACLYLSLQYSLGNEVEKDKEKADYWLKEAAAQKSTVAMSLLAYDALVKEKQEEFEFWMKKGIEEGCLVAYYDLGVFYLLNKNHEKAYAMFVEAAKSGFPGAFYNLGVFYYNGQYVEKDYIMAMKYFRKAIDHNFCHAYGPLGIIYYYGLSGKENYKKGLKIFLRGAEKGDALSCYELARIYKNGFGVNENQDLAEKYEILAEKYGYYLDNEAYLNLVMNTETMDLIKEKIANQIKSKYIY